MTAFTGDHYRQLREALVEAFPEPARLKELCQFSLGRNLARVTTGGSLDEQAFELIGHAQATGSLDELIKGAWELNDGNPHLRAFLRDLAPGWCFNLPEATLDARCLPMGHRIQKWKVLRHLGAGGMGTVYAVSAGYAESALKVLHAVTEQEDDGGDFERDVGRVATLTSNLRTDGVVKVHEGAFDPSLKVRWIRMELVRGESLRARVRRDGRLPVSELREVAEQLYDTLSEAHGAAGAVIHCDIKPENLFVEKTRRGLRLKVLDFGIARLAHERPLEKGGPAYGTALYAAPELWEGAAVSPATDVWSCALTVFYLLTGGEFWVSRYDQQLAEEIVASPQRSASARARELGVALPEGLDAWFAECLTVDPARRPASTEVAWQALCACISGFGDGALPAVAVEPPRAKDDEAVPEGAYVPSVVVASGVRLTQWLKERGPLSPQDVVKVVGDVSTAITVLRGIPGVRGTLEPERIVLETAADGSIQGARVADIEARAVAGNKAARGRTATLQLQRRFVRYANPVNAFGGKVAAPDDVWSLAMIAYETLTGVAFVEGMDAGRWAELASAPMAASTRAVEQEVSARIPQGFDDWFRWCVAGTEERFASVIASTRALSQVLLRVNDRAEPVGSGGSIASGESKPEANAVAAVAPNNSTRRRARPLVIPPGSLKLDMLREAYNEAGIGHLLPPIPDPPAPDPTGLAAQTNVVDLPTTHDPVTGASANQPVAREPAGEGSAPARTPAPATDAGEVVPENIRRMRLVFLAPTGTPPPVSLRRLPLILGRSEGAEVPLAFSSISREHARIFHERGELMIEDMGSSNGVQVNKEKVGRRRLQLGDHVQLGVVEFRVAGPVNHNVVFVPAYRPEERKPARRLPPTLVVSIVVAGLVLGLVVVFAFNRYNRGVSTQALALAGDAQATSADVAMISEAADIAPPGAPQDATLAVDAVDAVDAPEAAPPSAWNLAAVCSEELTSPDLDICVISALRGQTGERELGAYATSLIALGRRREALRAMRDYLHRYPDGGASGSFLSALQSR